MKTLLVGGLADGMEVEVRGDEIHIPHRTQWANLDPETMADLPVVITRLIYVRRDDGKYHFEREDGLPERKVNYLAMIMGVEQ